MRYEVIITASDLYLTPAQARNLLEDIESNSDLDGIRINTGFEYDSLIENEGSDSEDFQTQIKFYVDGDLETGISVGSKVMGGIKMMFEEIRENNLYFTLTDINSIEQYG
jgi:hypothetical protein